MAKKKKKLRPGFVSALSGITNIYSQFQHIYYKALSFCDKVLLNYCFYIHGNVIDIYTFLDFLSLMMGGLLKSLFLSFFTLFVSIFVFHSNGYF